MDSKDRSFSSGQLAQIGITLLSILGFWLYRTQLSTDNYSALVMGQSLYFWYWIAILTPILHQITIAPLWRSELLNNGMTATFGSTERAFTVFKLIFALYFFPRLLIALPLAIITANTISTPLSYLEYCVAIFLSPIIMYGFYSVKSYFGTTRAFGADHFFKEYRSMPKVEQGLFKYTDNAMYTFILTVIWVPSLFLLSFPGFLVGLFNHLIVWVHYFFIEKPDMNYIYGI